MASHAPPSPGTEPATSASRRGGRGPVFVAGPDRSGTTLIFALLASHPNISMVRRTNMWRYFHGRYGDLRDPENLERCLSDMTRYKRMGHLHPDAARIGREFAQGEPTYGRLFALFHEHEAERVGKPRWGDKSLHTEHYADRVFAEFPDARIVHIVRDPRDRYASVRKRHGRDVARVGAVTARWIDSTRAGRRGAARDPDRYLIIRYEDLAREPEATMREVCAFIDEPYEPAMLSMDGVPDHRDGSGNSSFGDLEPGTISTRSIGRFREVLTPSEIAFIQLTAGRLMRELGYEHADPGFGPRTRARFWVWDLPVQLGRVVGWRFVTRRELRRGETIPPVRLSEETDGDEADGG